MTDEKPKPKWIMAGIYALAYHQMIPAAKEKGYALAIHGTLGRDCDLLAVPWVEKAAPPEEMVRHLAETIGWVYHDDKGCPGKKPLGRLAFTIIEMESGMWIDLAVMPGHTPKEPQ